MVTAHSRRWVTSFDPQYLEMAEHGERSFGDAMSGLKIQHIYKIEPCAF